MLRGFNLNSSIFAKRIYLLIFNFCVFKKLLWCYNQAENEKSGQCPKGWSDLKLLDKLKSFGQRRDVDMTEGGITRHIVCFAIPLLLGNLFQQFYNTVDSWVVGNYVSDTAFSAVGTVGPIINMLINTFLGLSTGASVVISQFYGAKQHERVQDAVHTSVMMTLILGVVFTIIGIAMTPLMLNLMETPDSVRPEATQYLIIYFSGIISLMLYNMGSGILRAIGDSQRPFYFLVVSALTNVVLDLVFVLVFKMGVSGVAIATVVAQTLSAALVLIVLLRAKNCCRLSLKKLRIHRSMLAKILKVGIPAGIENGMFQIGKLSVSSLTSTLGTAAIAANAVAGNISSFLNVPASAVGIGALTVVGQCLGAGEKAQAKRYSRLLLLTAYAGDWAMNLSGLFFLNKLALSWFNLSPEAYGMALELMVWFNVVSLILWPSSFTLPNILRAAGDAAFTMTVSVVSMWVFRVAFCYLMVLKFHCGLLFIWLGMFLDWAMRSLFFCVRFVRGRWMEQKVI